jgi:hypothetical protein
VDCKEVRSEWVWHLGSGRGPRPQPEGRRRQGKERLFLKTCLLSSFRLGIGRGDCSRLRGGAGAVAVASEREPMGRMRGGRFNEKQAKDKRHRSPPPLPVQCRLQHSRLRQGVRSAHSRKRSAVAAAVASERQPMGRMRGGRFNEKQAKDKRHRSLPVGCKKEGSTGMFEYRLSSNARAREMAMSVRGGQQSRVGMQTNGQLQVCSRLWKMRLLVWVCALVAIGVLCDWQW